MCKTRISSRQRLVGLELMRVEISLSFYSFSGVVVGRENRDQSLDGGVAILCLMDMSLGVNECFQGYDWK